MRSLTRNAGLSSTQDGVNDYLENDLVGWRQYTEDNIYQDLGSLNNDYNSSYGQTTQTGDKNKTPWTRADECKWVEKESSSDIQETS